MNIHILVLVIAIALFGVLAFKQMSALILAPLVTIFVILCSGLPILDSLKGLFMPAATDYITKYFLTFFVGALFGAVYQYTGAAESIARAIAGLCHGKFVAPIIMCITGILTFGGVSGFVVFFVIYPIALNLFKEGNLTRRLIPAAISAAGSAAVPKNLQSLSYYDHFLSVVPDNVLHPFLEGNVLSVLVIAVAVGLALAFMPRTEGRDSLLRVIFGLQELLFTLIRALLFILPVGILAFAGQLSSQIEAGVIVGSLGKYVAVVVTGNLLQFFVVLPLFLLARRINPLRVLKGMFPALAVALFSKSSAGTLPVTLASAEQNLRLDRRVTRFVLPICTTINMNGCAAFILVTSLYLMQNAGIAITGGTMAVWVVVAVIAAIGNAGVPMGCYFLTLSLMSSLNVPVDLMGVILPVYAIIDMIETAVNVASDSCVATMTDHDLKGKLPPAESDAPDAPVPQAA